MSVIFKASGKLDINSNPSDLPEVVDQLNIQSEALTRCKNIRLIRDGIGETRFGTVKLIDAALKTPIRLIVTNNDKRYAIGGDTAYEDESSLGSGLSQGIWTSIKYNAFNDDTKQIFATNGSDRKRLSDGALNEWGIAAPTDPPEIADGTSTGLTGAYYVKYTYLRKVGSVTVCESNPSDASNTVTLSNTGLAVKWFASDDSQVTHVRIYRTAASGSTYLFDQDVAIGATSVNTTTADGSLGSAVAINHDRPPTGGAVLGPLYGGICFIIKSNRLYYCLSKQPEYWPSDYYIEVGDIDHPGTALCAYGGNLHYFTEHEIYYIQGTTPGAFFPLPLETGGGALSPKQVVSIKGYGIFHYSKTGLYLYSNGKDSNVLKNRFDPLFNGREVGGIPPVIPSVENWLAYFNEVLYFGYISSGNAYPSNILAINLKSEKVSYYQYKGSSVIQLSHVVADDHEQQIIAGDDKGFLRLLEAKNASKDDDEDIEWEVQSKDFMLSTRRHFPRWAKYDIDVKSGDCTGEIILDDESIQSHAITGTRQTNRRMIATENGNRGAMRISGSGKSIIYGVEVE